MKRLFNLALSVLLLLTTVPMHSMAETSNGEKLYNKTAINAVAGDGKVDLEWIKPVAKDHTMLFVGQGLPPDEKTIQYLQTLGFSSIDFANAKEVETEDAEGYDIIFVGESASSHDIGQKFMKVPIPVIYSKGWVLDKVYLSSGGVGEFGDLDWHTSIDIKDSQHPLAAGLNGIVNVYSKAGKINFGTPGDEATVIATIEGEDPKASIYAYEEGDKNINGDPVPARRVSTFLFSGQEDYVTENGWRLIEEAVIWALNLEDDKHATNETYSIKRSESPGGPYDEIAKISGTFYSDTDLKNGITYHYKVTMITDDGEYEIFPELSATPGEPLAMPTELKAIAGNGEIEISWEPVEGAMSYDIKRTSDSDDSFALIENVKESSYIDTDVKNGITYSYVISAKDEIRSSEISEPVSATPIDSRPVITLDQANDVYVNEEIFTVSGSIDKIANVMINDKKVEVASDLSFSLDIQLEAGENIIQVEATGEDGEQAKTEIKVIYDIEPPTLNINDPEGELEDGYYSTIFNPYIISGSLSEPGIILINDQEFKLSDDLSFNEEIALESGVINELTIVGIDLAGNQSEEIVIHVAPVADAVPAGPIKIESAVVKEPHIIEVTFNGVISNFDPNDLELQSALGDWDDLNPRLTSNFNILKTETYISENGQTVANIEIEETLNMDGTISREVVEDPHRVPYLKANYYSDDIEKSIEQAENLLTWQMDHGGWDKNKSDNDYTRPWDGEERKSGSYSSIHGVEAGTIDNDATIDEILFLALMYKETGDERYKDSALRGIKYILDSQYDTGGFPQVYPLVGGYPDAVTFNDDAMVRVLNILTLISENKYPFNTDIISEDLVENINNALDLALDYLLNSQIVVDGQLTAWGQQHDPFTYEPTTGRAYEHPSIAAYESVRTIMYLMSLPNQTPEIKSAIEGALNWYDEVKVEGVRFVSGDPNNQYFYEDPESTTWYRFYQIGTNLPIFSGRDGVVKHDILEIEEERRNGYQWAGSYGSDILRIANTTGYYENHAYVKVVDNNSFNIADERLVVGELHRIEAYDDSDEPGEPEEPEKPSKPEAPEKPEQPEQPGDSDPGKTDELDQKPDVSDDNDKQEEPEKVEETNKLPKTATNMFNWFILGALLIGLATAIYSYQRIRQRE